MKKEITVEAVSLKNGGIKDDKKWYNLGGTPTDETINKMAEKLKTIDKGDVIKIEIDDLTQGYIDFEILSKSPFAKKKFDDLLKDARKAHPDMSIETKMLTTNEGKSIIEDGWMCQAAITIPTKEGSDQTFTGHGEATPKNTIDSGQKVQESLPRVAETRAMSRVLRWLMAETTVKEEIDGNSELP